MYGKQRWHVIVSQERTNFVSFAEVRYPNITYLDLKDKSILLMSQEDSEPIKVLAKNVSLAFRKRENYTNGKS